MNVRSLTAATVGTLLSTGAAFAGVSDFVGISFEHVGTWDGTNAVIRLYANFIGPGSQVTYWGGDGGSKAFTISNDWELIGDAAGSGFWQAPFAAGPMVQVGGPLYNFMPDEFDNSTYMTIGVEAGYIPFGQPGAQVGEVFQLTPGFNPPVNGETTFGGAGGIVSSPGAPNTFADKNGRVLLAQFTINKCETVSGSNIRLHVITDGAHFEFTGLSFAQLGSIPHGDLNHDGSIDVLDLLILLGNWGPCPETCLGDINCSGEVDVEDLLFLLANWG